MSGASSRTGREIRHCDVAKTRAAAANSAARASRAVVASAAMARYAARFGRLLRRVIDAGGRIGAGHSLEYRLVMCGGGGSGGREDHRHGEGCIEIQPVAPLVRLDAAGRVRRRLVHHPNPEASDDHVFARGRGDRQRTIGLLPIGVSDRASDPHGIENELA
jgi:hypothetical protein